MQNFKYKSNDEKKGPFKYILVNETSSNLIVNLRFNVGFDLVRNLNCYETNLWSDIKITLRKYGNFDQFCKLRN